MMKMLLACFSASMGFIKHELPKDNTSEMACEVLNSGGKKSASLQSSKPVKMNRSDFIINHSQCHLKTQR